MGLALLLLARAQASPAVGLADPQQIALGLAALSKNGLRYPIPNHGLDKSPLASLAQSYGDDRK